MHTFNAKIGLDFMHILLFPRAAIQDIRAVIQHAVCATSLFFSLKENCQEAAILLVTFHFSYYTKRILASVLYTMHITITKIYYITSLLTVVFKEVDSFPPHATAGGTWQKRKLYGCLAVNSLLSTSGAIPIGISRVRQVLIT